MPRRLPSLAAVGIAGSLLVFVGTLPATAMLPSPEGQIGSGSIQLQQPLVSLAGPSLAGEGVYRAAVMVAGRPVVQVAWLRPGPGLDAYPTGLMWMSGTRTTLVLHPGYADPGKLSGWVAADYLSGSPSSGLVAAFNSGFKLKDIWGGYYDNGRYAQPLKVGRAAIVVYKDGHTDIGLWGTQVVMSSAVQSVRQNERLLVDGGRISPLIDSSIQTNWGVTVGKVNATWRTGLGTTASGDLVYVAGPKLTPRLLARALQDAGAVRAIELDINSDWATGVFFTPLAAGSLSAHKIAPFTKPANRYFSPTDRDFYAVMAR
ncbi:MAG: hypothetical protein WCJ42_11310 [Actinomycetes bacterium]